MAVKLNLLPQDHIVSGSLSKILKIVRPANIILLFLFLILALGISGYFILSSLTLKDLNTSKTELTNQINSQEKAQQQVILLKDRLAKIKIILTNTQLNYNLKTVEPLLTNIADTDELSELSLDPQKTDIKLVFKSNSFLKTFLDNLANQEAFAAIIMETFNYTPQNGYSFELSFAHK